MRIGELLGWLLGLVGGVLLPTAHGLEKPNVLLIVADDLGAQALGCYGNPICRTPHLDQLASQGLRFERAYCQYPVCGPSRAAMMTGTYPECVGVNGNGGAERLNAWLGERPSLPQLFREHGWTTARFSKIYHMRVPGDITKGVSGPDHEPSWDLAWNAHAPEWQTEGVAEQLSNERLRLEPDVHYGLGFGTAFYTVRDPDPQGTQQADAQAVTAANAWLKTHRDEPFFLAVGLVRPHVPLVAPEALFAGYPPEQLVLPEVPADDWDDIPRAGISKNSRSSGLEELGDQQRVLQAYYAACEFMDVQVGRLLQQLDDLGLSDRTIVVFTSDHGYHLGEHHFWQKLSLHEESVRIPLILRIPGQEPGEVSALAEQIDLYPTLAELAGLSIPEHVMGSSWVPLWTGQAAAVHDSVYCRRGQDHLLRTTEWALLQYADGTGELYEMQADPRQYRNRISDDDVQPILTDLQSRLAEKRRQIEAAVLRPANAN